MIRSEQRAGLGLSEQKSLFILSLSLSLPPNFFSPFLRFSFGLVGSKNGWMVPGGRKKRNRTNAH